MQNPTDVHTASQPQQAGIPIAFWNLQNLFDIDGSPIAAELEFTPVCGWDRNALEAKVRALATVVRLMFDGRGPDLLGICEIENERVARYLMREIGRQDYQLVSAGHADGRALDTALIVSDRHFAVDHSRTRAHSVSVRFPTCDILEVHLKVLPAGAELMVLVCHWPAQQPDRPDASALRMTAAACCRQIVHRYLKAGRREYVELRDNDVSLFHLDQLASRNVLILGDMNDEPWSPSLLLGLGAGFSVDSLHESLQLTGRPLPSWKTYSSRLPSLFNPMWALVQPDIGTTASDSPPHTMALHDQLIISPGLYLGRQGLRLHQHADGIPEVLIFRPELLRDESGRPRPFSLADHSGCSDHFPIGAVLEIC